MVSLLDEAKEQTSKQGSLQSEIQQEEINELVVSDQEFKEIVPEEVKERLQRSTISPSKNRDSDMKGYPSTIEKGEDDEVE